MTTPIIGLQKPIEDPGTGVMLGFHVVRVYQVDVVAQRVLVTFSSYVSRGAFAAGKNPVSAISVSNLPGLPVGDAVQWCYATVVHPGGDNALADATPVHADPVEAAE